MISSQSWRRWLNELLANGKGHVRRNSATGYRPCVELLEDRWAPAIYNVSTLTDPAVGSVAWNAFTRNSCSLRWAITDLNANVREKVSGPFFA